MATACLSSPITPRWPGTVETLARAAAFFELDLVAHGGDGLRVGPDEHDAGRRQRLRKGGALGEKSVARMHRLGPARSAGGDDVVDDQVALRRRRRPDRDGAVGHFHVQRVAVGVRIDGDRLDPQPASGLDDPTRDLAAIGNQYSFEHLPL